MKKYTVFICLIICPQNVLSMKRSDTTRNGLYRLGAQYITAGGRKIERILPRPVSTSDLKEKDDSSSDEEDPDLIFKFDEPELNK